MVKYKEKLQGATFNYAMDLTHLSHLQKKYFFRPKGGIRGPAEVFTEPGVEEYLKEELKTVVQSINALRKFCLVRFPSFSSVRANGRTEICRDDRYEILYSSKRVRVRTTTTTQIFSS